MGNTMRAADLAGIVTTARLFTCTDKNLPMITAIRLEATENQIIAVATDRYVLGTARCDYSGEAFDLTIDGGVAERLSKLAKTAPREYASRTVALNLTDGVEFVFSTGETLAVTRSAHQFPNWRRLIPTEIDVPAEERSGMWAYNPQFLAKFAKVGGPGGNNMRLFSCGIDKKTVVRIGDDFVGVIMHARDDRHKFDRPAWLDA